MLFRNFPSFWVKWVSERPKISNWFWFKVSSIKSFFVESKRLFVLSEAIFIGIEIYSGSIDKVWFGKCESVLELCIIVWVLVIRVVLVLKSCKLGIKKKDY